MPDKNTGISERFAKVIKTLDINANSLAKALGYARSQTIYDILNGKSAPSFDFLNRFEMSEYSEVINISWFITGNGNMLKRDGPFFEDHLFGDERDLKDMKSPSGVNNRIPLYEVSSSMDLSTIFTVEGKQTAVDYLSIPNAPICDGALIVRGDSMYPILKAGDIVCYKALQSLDNFYYGEMYLLDIDVDGERFMTFRYVNKSHLGDDYLYLVSHNEQHSSQNVLRKYIQAMALVKVSVRYNTIL